jgi:hypothetical protein
MVNFIVWSPARELVMEWNGLDPPLIPGGRHAKPYANVRLNRH